MSLLVTGKPIHKESEILSYPGQKNGPGFSINHPTKFPEPVIGAVSYPGTLPMICGGYNEQANLVSQACYKLVDEAWLLNENSLITPRHLAASVRLYRPELMWWITGGKTPSEARTASTELLGESGFRTGPQLPAAVYGHCMVRLPDTHTDTVLLIGGYGGADNTGSGLSASTWSYSISSDLTFQPSLLNSLKVARMNHACSVVKRSQQSGDGEYSVVVAGGWNNNVLDTVEIFDYSPDGLYVEWKLKVLEGQKLPIPVSSAQLLPSYLDTSALLLVGGHSPDAGGQLSTLIEYRNSNWTLLTNMALNNYRRDFQAIPLVIKCN